MKRTDGHQMTEVIHAVCRQDKVNSGVAKARFAGEAKYSVPSLERLLRGERASTDIQLQTMKAIRGRGINVKAEELFLDEESEADEAS